ncbi:unnamed protein product [Dovyalis caffra]|uniref:Glycosyltransferase n=1 Tax=Dovyalis caffra TaxID=77055 RepID=A0AAV1RS42_9ROSI|nr:unnamed protein product [Dovyalis caffra]
MQNTKPHAALLASPGMGHLIPIVELGKRLVTYHGFHVTIFVVATDVSATQSLLRQQCPNLNIIKLPLVDIPGLIDSTATIVTKLAVMMRETLPSLRSAILALKSPPTALIVDVFGTEAFAVAEELNMLKYVFDTSNAWFLAITIYVPTIDKNVEDKHIIQKQPLRIPGCKSVRFDDTLEAYLDRNDQTYIEYKRIGIEMPMADGILVNTWEDLEPSTLGALRDSQMLGRVAKVPVYPIGPLSRPVGPSVTRNQVLNWLDMQRNESVIYVSFGSGGTLSSDQMTELAWGLELSKQRFVWVVRPPIDNDASGTFFNLEDGSQEAQSFLPKGFLARTSEVGLVIPMWAPQVEILAHPSVGGFLSHCGWNSTLESITNGVPMIAWPLYAEQKMNATLLTEELGVAVQPKTSASECVVARAEIEMMVRRIMEDEDGFEIRKTAKELKYSGEKALSSKGGSSYNSLSQIANDCELSLLFRKAKAQGS